MILSDREIRSFLLHKHVQIEPRPWDECIQPASVDLRLGSQFQVFRNHREGYIDPAEKQDLTEPYVAERFFMLHPGDFVLGATDEWVSITGSGVRIPEMGMTVGLAARVEGKSSLGRLGLLVHSTAGYIDPGFRGNITLELANVSRLPIRLTPGMRICQIRFELTSSPPLRPYGHAGLGSHYQDSIGAVPA